MRLGAFTAVVLRSLSRDRTAMFFVLVLPVIVIVIIGTTFGGARRLDVGLVVADRGPVGERVAAALDRADGIAVQRFDGTDDLAAAVRRVRVGGGLVLPAGTSEAIERGSTAEVQWVSGPSDPDGIAARLATQGALDEVTARLGAARFAVEQVGADYGSALATVDGLAGEGVGVEVSDVGDGGGRDLSAFSLVAPQQLVLFVFINALTSAILIVQARRSGVLRRALATRTSLPTLLVGLGLGWLVFALLQSALIVVIGRVLFDVDWGDPAAASALVLVWALVGTGAGLLVGAVGRDEDRVGAIGPIVGIVLASLGGCTVPLEIFPAPMLALAHGVPHYWAVTGWQRVIFDGGGVADIFGSLAVLLAFAAAMVGVAAVVLRRQLLSP